MQTLKYISDGGITIRKNLFNQWMNLYENEVQAYGHQLGIKAMPPQQFDNSEQGTDSPRPGSNMYNLKFDKK